jgi:GNAT superfamily N-acetyltransferase
MVTVIACPAPDCDQALALLDQEFISSRGRTLSLSIRFESVLSQPDARFLATRNQGKLESILLLRPFEWITPSRSYRAAMIGLVWTHPEARGRGHGSALLVEAAQSMRRDEIDFAVLWTTRAGFYARAGWIPADCGVLGHWRGGESATGAPPEARTLWPAIHSVREACGAERVRRTLADYTMLPPPAIEHDAALEDGAYALIGRLGVTGYLYEIGGRSDGLPALWRGLRQRYRELFINVRRDAEQHQWLSAQPGITWKDQNLAMWLALSGDADARRFRGWYIPFLDRI